MLNNVNMFGGEIIIAYLCTTESVDNPTGGATKVGESGRSSAYIFLYNPARYGNNRKQKIPTRYGQVVRSRIIN